MLRRSCAEPLLPAISSSPDLAHAAQTEEAHFYYIFHAFHPNH
jgi:hypothetical protein